MNNNLVSICLATYNGEKYLKEQLDSLLNQTYNNIEIIIQDDCSNDRTVDIVSEYKNITIYKNEQNLGYIKNFESLIKKASGDYIAICDQDDIWELDKVELLLKNIGTNTLIYSNSLLIDENSNSLNKTLSQKLKNNFIDSNNCLNFLYDNCVSAHAVLFKKELLQYIFPFPTHIYFDAWIASTAANLDGVKYLDKNLVQYRQHSSNTLGNVKKAKLSAKDKIVNKVNKKISEVLSILDKIKELKEIKTINEDQLLLLNELESYYMKFSSSWLNIGMFSFLLKNSNQFFKITKKNIYSLSLKKSFGKKLYKAVPFL